MRIGKGFVTALSVGLLACLICVGGAEAGKKYLIRHKFRDGQKLAYSLSVAGKAFWYPEQNDLSGGEMGTDFLFTLSHKVTRETGACTFDMRGQRLRSRVETEKGTISIEATPEECDLDIQGHRLEIDRANPLKHAATLTMGPRGVVRYGTGLGRLAPYFIVHVNPHFWRALTLAPREEVGVGDEWEESFNVRIPDSRGKPLNVKLRAKVTGWETHRGHRCLAGRVRAQLKLKETRVTLKNGDRLHVDRGEYEADGKVLWDPAQGILCHASARNRLTVTSTKPRKRRFSGQARCTLKLLDSK
jgi:hypothetical protein